jgi:hypothetical protein
MPPRRSLAAACAAGAALAGCGGGQPPSQSERVTTVVRSFLTAQADGDGEAACALLTPAAQQRLVAVVARRAAGLGAAPGSCAEAVGLVRAVAPAKLLTAIRRAHVQRVAVQGDRATATVVDGQAFPAQRAVLEQRDGAWRIAAVPSLIGG